MVVSSGRLCVAVEIGTNIDGGVVATFVVYGGVDPAVGVLEAGDLRVMGELAWRGSAECWRFSYHRELAYFRRL